MIYSIVISRLLEAVSGRLFHLAGVRHVDVFAETDVDVDVAVAEVLLGDDRLRCWSRWESRKCVTVVEYMS